MIKAKEAKAISISVELDQQVLDKISKAIITEASKGNYAVKVSHPLPIDKVDRYIDYLKELGFKTHPLYKGEHGIYITWKLTE